MFHFLVQMLFTASDPVLIFTVTQHATVPSSQQDFGSVNEERSQSQQNFKWPQASIVKSEKVFLSTHKTELWYDESQRK